MAERLVSFQSRLDRYPTLNLNVAAEHNGTAKGWAESRGLSYLAARLSRVRYGH